jgi:hypothetical protein
MSRAGREEDEGLSFFLLNHRGLRAAFSFPPANQLASLNVMN